MPNQRDPAYAANINRELDAWISFVACVFTLTVIGAVFHDGPTGSDTTNLPASPQAGGECIDTARHNVLFFLREWAGVDYSSYWLDAANQLHVVGTDGHIVFNLTRMCA